MSESGSPSTDLFKNFDDVVDSLHEALRVLPSKKRPLRSPDELLQVVASALAQLRLATEELRMIVYVTQLEASGLEEKLTAVAGMSVEDLTPIDKETAFEYLKSVASTQ